MSGVRGLVTSLVAASQCPALPGRRDRQQRWAAWRAEAAGPGGVLRASAWRDAAAEAGVLLQEVSGHVNHAALRAGAFRSGCTAPAPTLWAGGRLWLPHAGREQVLCSPVSIQEWAEPPCPAALCPLCMRVHMKSLHRYPNLPGGQGPKEEGLGGMAHWGPISAALGWHIPQLSSKEGCPALLGRGSGIMSLCQKDIS